MLVFEEIPASFVARHKKSVTDSLHHMLACITFYVTDTLNRTEKKALSSIFNLIGRKLLGDDLDSKSELDVKPQVEADDTVSKRSDKSLKSHKTLELKALDNHAIKENPITKNTTFMSFTGNEDIALINAHIIQNR